MQINESRWNNCKMLQIFVSCCNPLWNIMKGIGWYKVLQSGVKVCEMM
jgi:hypothetical protein